MNQIGTVTETIDMARTAKEAGWGVVACHRSGETEVSWGWGCHLDGAGDGGEAMRVP